MEENNNNDSKIVDQIKDTTKKEAKKLVNKGMKKVVVWAAPAIGMFFLILLFVGLLNVITSLVLSFFTSIFNPTDATSTDASNTIKSVISINSNGEYKVNNSIAEQIIEELESKKIDTEKFEFIKDDFDNLIDKYIKAQFQTMLPKTGKPGNDLDGNVIIKRQFTDSRGLKTLNYIPYDDFISRINSQDSSVLECFSINPDNFYLMLAEDSSTVQTCYNFDGSIIGEKSSSTAITIVDGEGIDYLTAIQNYGLPFNFFLSLHMIALDAKFMNDLVDDVLNDDAPVVLTYVETETKEKIENVYKGYYFEGGKVVGKERANEQSEWVTLDRDETTKTIDITSNNIKNYLPMFTDEVELKDFWKLETSSKKGKLYVTSANTWLKRTEKKIENESTSPSVTTTPENPELIKFINRNIGEKEYIFEDNKRAMISRWTKLEYTETLEKSIEVELYTVVDDVNEIKVQEFIEFINKYPSVVDNLISAPSQLLYSLQQDESTQKLEQVMRYIMYRLTGVDYGVISESDIEKLLSDMQEFNIIKGDSAENFIKAWHNDVVWEYETEQISSLPTGYLTDDGLNYIVYENGDEKHNNIGPIGETFIENSSASTTNSNYANHEKYGAGLYKWKDELAKYDIKVEELKEGDYVSIEAVTSAFENEIIPKVKQEVDTYLSDNLSGYTFTYEQKDALYSICYEYGNIAGFEEAYTASFDGENLDPEKIKTEYDRFNYTSELYDRKYANWVLFTEGVYIDKLGNEIAMGGRIVETAYMVGDYFINCPNAPVKYSAEYLNKNNIKIREGTIQQSWDDAAYDPNYGMVCATFISFTLWKAGLIDESAFDYPTSFHACSGIIKILESPEYKDQWQKITNWSDLREGDIVVDSEHTYIYMDGGKMLDQHYCVISTGGADWRGKLGTASINNFHDSSTRVGRAYRYIGKKLGE